MGRTKWAKELRAVPTVSTKSARVLRLKEELNLILELVVHSRESLQNELESEFAQKKSSIDDKFLRKLKELTACYGTLTDARIRLDKSERAMEKEMTPEDELETVEMFVKAMENVERARWLHKMISFHKSCIAIPSRSTLGDDLPIE